MKDIWNTQKGLKDIPLVMYPSMLARHYYCQNIQLLSDSAIYHSDSAFYFVLFVYDAFWVTLQKNIRTLVTSQLR